MGPCGVVPFSGTLGLPVRGNTSHTPGNITGRPGILPPEAGNFTATVILPPSRAGPTVILPAGGNITAPVGNVTGAGGNITGRLGNIPGPAGILPAFGGGVPGRRGDIPEGGVDIPPRPPIEMSPDDRWGALAVLSPASRLNSPLLPG